MAVDNSIDEIHYSLLLTLRHLVQIDDNDFSGNQLVRRPADVIELLRLKQEHFADLFQNLLVLLICALAIIRFMNEILNPTHSSPTFSESADSLLSQLLTVLFHRQFGVVNLICFFFPDIPVMPRGIHDSCHIFLFFRIPLDKAILPCILH